MKNKNINNKITKIRSNLRWVLIASTVPFLIVVIADILRSDSDEEKLIITAIFIFAFGLALLASKLASHTAVVQYLKSIADIDTAKSDFISIASHQLKSPVSALKYTLEIMEKSISKKDWEMINTLSKDLEASSERLHKLTHDLLDVTRIDNETTEFQPENISLQKEIEQAVLELEPIAKANNVSIETDYKTSTNIKVYSDPNLFYNVLENLLTNAIEYAQKNTKIKINLINKNTFVKVSIINKTNEPVSQDEISQIFSKFNRGSTGKKANSSGSGLGLYIVKSYVEKWGGEIMVETETDNLISFSFTIPKSIKL